MAIVYLHQKECIPCLYKSKRREWGVDAPRDTRTYSHTGRRPGGNTIGTVSPYPWHGPSRLPLYKSVPITFPLPGTSGVQIYASWQTALVLPGERSRRLLLPSLHGWGSVTPYELGEAVQLAELGLVGSLHISWFHVKLNHYTHTHTLLGH